MLGSLRRGFSLIELLVVMAVIGILIALIVPAVQRAREAAARTQCTNHLKQIGLAMQNYHEVHKHFPMGSWNGVPYFKSEVTANIRGGTWFIEILPYVGEQNLYHSLLRDKTGTFNGSGSNNPKNAAAFADRGAIEVFVCPSSPCPKVTTQMDSSVPPWLAPAATNDGRIGICIPSYAGIAGGDMGYMEGPELRFKTTRPEINFNTAMGSVATDGVLVPCRNIRVVDITDGTSNTIAVGEQSDWGELGGKRFDIRSSAYSGGFMGTGLPGYYEEGKEILFESPKPARWQSSSYYQATSAGLTTVRWPLSFKKIPFIQGWQYDFPNPPSPWRHCSAGPGCGGNWGGLISVNGWTTVCPKWYGPAGNTPLQSAHGQGALVLFADGHVTFLHNHDADVGLFGIDNLAGRDSVLERLCVRDDGREVKLPD